MDPDSKLLRDLNADANVFVTRKQHGVGNCVISCQIDEISDYQRINTFLLTRCIYEAQSQFDVVGIASL